MLGKFRMNTSFSVQVNTQKRTTQWKRLADSGVHGNVPPFDPVFVFMQILVCGRIIGCAPSLRLENPGSAIVSNHALILYHKSMETKFEAR